MRRIATVTLLALLIARPDASVAVDLNGRWHLDIGIHAIVTVTQTGSALSIPVSGLVFTGTVGATDANGFTSYSVTWTDGMNQAGFGGRIMPSGNLLDGRVGSFFPPSPPTVGPLVATRCTCFDDNAVNGDGCDVTCQVEPCHTCVGDPSVCTPTVDGGVCDDFSPCTTGETCTVGVCGGGAPVAPCFDIAGSWSLHSAIPALGVVSHTIANVSQRGSEVRIGGYVGSIDTTTGALNVRAANPNLFCGPFDVLLGSVASDGLTFSMGGFVEEPQPSTPDHCDSFAQTLLGDHCGDGTLEGPEACDDGNLVDGDGCSVQCGVEQCWTCTGAPSVCGPVGGGPCTDGNGCTINDTCAGDGSCAGAPVDCGQCHTCSETLGCIADPGASCDDGAACTTGDICAGDGSCAGTPQICEPCFACDGILGCVLEPQAGCKASTAPEKSWLVLKNFAEDGKDEILWRWNKGAGTTLSELGNPPDGENVTLCVYDESTATTTLLFRATAPGDDRWTATTKGFRFRAHTEANDGIAVAQLHSGIAGKARAKMKGKGALLSNRPYGLPAPAVPLPLRAQLQSGNGLCLETRHDASGVLKNDSTRGIFKARGTP